MRKRKLIEEIIWLVEKQNDEIPKDLQKITYNDLVGQPKENLGMMLEQLHTVIKRK
jgi:predicted nucleic acid-binding OB-fold protein